MPAESDRPADTAATNPAPAETSASTRAAAGAAIANVTPIADLGNVWKQIGKLREPTEFRVSYDTLHRAGIDPKLSGNNAHPRSTDQAITMSNSRRAASRQSLSNADVGLLSLADENLGRIPLNARSS